VVENLELKNLLAALVTAAAAADPSSALQLVAKGLVLVLVCVPLVQLIPPALGVVPRGLVWFGFGFGFGFGFDFDSPSTQLILQLFELLSKVWFWFWFFAPLVQLILQLLLLLLKDL
jgi:hypothetical protein